MARGFFLPLAIEGEYDTYIVTTSIRYSLLPSYIITILLLLTLSAFNISSNKWFIYQLLSLFLLHTSIHIYFIFWFERDFGLEKIITQLTKKQTFLSFIRCMGMAALVLMISLFFQAFFERGNIPINIALSIIFPYLFANLIHGGINEGMKTFLSLINFRNE